MNLKRELSLFDSTMLVIGSMIGSAIFIVPTEIARITGSAGYLMIVWIASGLITIMGALSFGELAAMMPKAGGQYIYLRQAFNPLIGFLYGWTFFLVIQCGSIAAIAVAFAKFLATLFPVLQIWQLGNISGISLIAILSIIILTYINSRGMEEGKIIQNVLTVIKTVALLGLIILGIAFSTHSEAGSINWSNLFDPMTINNGPNGLINVPLSGWALFTSLCVATVGAIFAMDAWNNLTFTAGEVVNPRRTIPMSLFIGTGSVFLLYILVNITMILVLPVRGDPQGATDFARGMAFATQEQVGIITAMQLFGTIGGIVMAVLIMISAFGCNNALILSGARVFYAMAEDGLFFKKAKSLNRKGAPSWALFWQCLWSCVLCLSGTYNELLEYVVFAVMIFYILTVAGVFILRVKDPHAERPYKVTGYPVMPALYIIFALAISICLLIERPYTTLPGVFIVILGIPVYYLWKRLAHE